MNLSARILDDDSFMYYLDEDPCPTVGVLGGPQTIRTAVVEGLRSVSSKAQRMHVLPVASLDHLYLKKASRSTFEGYRPQSVLKLNWCRKHQRQVFSVVVYLVDWDVIRIYDRAQFEQHLLGLVDIVRHQLRTSINTRVVLGLTTSKESSGDPAPCGSFPSIEEAQNSLRSKLSLDQKSLVVLYKDGGDAHYIGRLYKAVAEHSVRYHREEIARIKKLKGDAARSVMSHVLLARHRFKAAWHSLVLDDRQQMRHNLDKAYGFLLPFLLGTGTQAGGSFAGGGAGGAGASGSLASVPVDPSGISIMTVPEGLSYAAAPPPSSTIDLRVAATIIAWTQVASNLNQLAQVQSDASPRWAHDVESSIAAFNRHMTILSKPFSQRAVLAVMQGVNIATVEGLAKLEETRSSMLLLQQMHVAEWQERLAKKIAIVVEAGTKQQRPGAGNFIKPGTEAFQLCFPGHHLVNAAGGYKTLRDAIWRRQQQQQHLTGSQSGADFGSPTAAESPSTTSQTSAAKRPNPGVTGHLGLEYLLPTFATYATQTVEPRQLSQRMCDLLVTARNHILAIPPLPTSSCSYRRPLWAIDFDIADHFLTFSDQQDVALERLLRLIEETPAAAFDVVSASLATAAAVTCRRLGKAADAGGTSSSSPPHLLTTLVQSLLFLLGNPTLNSTAQMKVFQQLTKTVLERRSQLLTETGGGVHFFVHSTPAAMACAPVLLSANASFSCPYVAARDINQRAGEGKALLNVVIRSAGCRLPLSFSSIALQLSSVRRISAGANTWTSTPRRTVVVDRSDLRVAAGMPLCLKIPLEFSEAELVEVSSITCSLAFPHQPPPAEGSTDASNDEDDVSLPIVMPFDNSSMFTMFDTFIYDASSWEIRCPLRKYWARQSFQHRPVIRVVPAVPYALLETSQEAHSIEAEDYTVNVTITSTGDTLRNMTLLVAYLPSVLELVDVTGTFNEINGASLVDETDAAAWAPFTPYEYSMSALRLPQELTLSTSKEGKNAISFPLVLRCLRAGKYELPLRLNYSSPTRGDFSVTHTLSIHVCHPVFVHYDLESSFSWRLALHGSKTSEQGEDDRVVASVMHDKARAQFIESSVLRDAASLADLADDVDSGSRSLDHTILAASSSSTFSAQVGKVARVDGVFSPVGPNSAAAAIFPQMQFIQFTVMHYSVERSQIPSAGQQLPVALVVERNSNVFISCRFSNSLQFPFLLHDVKIAPSPKTRITSVTDAIAELPVCLGMDEDYTFAFSFSAAACGVVNAGTLVLIISRVTSPGEKIRFSLPLPEVTVTDQDIQLAVEYPPTAVVGMPFTATCHVCNSSSTQLLKCDLILGNASAPSSASQQQRSAASPLPPSSLPGPLTSDAFIVSGRNTWRLTLGPGEVKTTRVRMTPLQTGMLSLPAIHLANVTDAASGKVLGHTVNVSNELVRDVLVQPLTIQGP